MLHSAENKTGNGDKATAGNSKRASQAIMTSNVNNTMSSLGVSNQMPATGLGKERKSIDVTKKTNILSNQMMTFYLIWT